jgi:hypothetical protein
MLDAAARDRPLLHRGVLPSPRSIEMKARAAVAHHFFFLVSKHLQDSAANPSRTSAVAQI